MLSLDLFNSQFEKNLHEGAVDELEQRRIHDLNMKMLELLDRAKEPAYKKSPEALAGLKREFKKVKDERDSYFKINPRTGMDPTGSIGTVKGKLDEVDPPQRPPAKGLLKNKDLITPQQRVAGATPSKPGVAGAVKDVAGGLKRWLKGEPDSGPTYEQQQPGQSPRALGAANFQRLVKANMGNVPTVNFEFIRSEENFKLDQRGLDLISDYYDGLENDQAKNYFIYRVLPSGDETLKVLKQLGWTPALPVQQELPGMPMQGELPLSEKKKSESEPNFKAGDVKVARELQKLRAQYPAARSDVEAVARAEIDSNERSNQQIAAIRGANEKQDALLKQLVALDQEQGREINSLDQENNTLEKELAKIQSTNDRLQQTIGQMTGTKKSAKTSKTSAKSIDLIPGAQPDTRVIATSEPVVEPTPTRSSSPAMAAMAQQIQGLNKAAPTIRPAPGLKAANEPIEPKVSGSDIAEHGGGIGPRQHWQDLMPEQSNPEDDDWYNDEEDQETELRSGDYVRDTMDGEHGEIFRMQGDPYERRVRILDRDGKGWYIEPSRLTRVDPQDPDVQRYFGKNRQRDVDESSVAESAKPGEYYIHTVYFKDGTKKRVRVTSDEFDVADYYTKRGQAVDHVDYDFQLHSDMAEDKIKEEALVEGIKDAAGATAVIACLLTGGSLTGCATSPQQTSAQQVLKTGQDIGRTVQTAKRITRAGTEAEVQQELRNILRGVGGRPEELNHSNILRIWRKVNEPKPQQNEAREIVSKEDFVRERDRLLRMIGQETNPANKQILRSAIQQLENRAEQEGWLTIQQRMVREDNDSEAVEQAILKRIMVAHTDLLQQYGPQKVMQAAEEVAYNVGDVDEIGTSDVSAYVAQVKQILGAVA